MSTGTAAFRDWLFAKPSKRLLLEALLKGGDRSWTRTELAGAAGQHKKARMDLHLEPLVDAGLLRRDDKSYSFAADSPLADALRGLLDELEDSAR